MGVSLLGVQAVVSAALGSEIEIRTIIEGVQILDVRLVFRLF
jgi:hypothetical protein